LSKFKQYTGPYVLKMSEKCRSNGSLVNSDGLVRFTSSFTPDYSQKRGTDPLIYT